MGYLAPVTSLFSHTIPLTADTSSSLRIGPGSFLPGQSGIVDLPIGSLIDYQPVTMRVHVRRSKQEGPTLLLTAGLHGDELIGVEILRRLLNVKRLSISCGTLLVVPVVCMPAFLGRSRYLPDRRDLNRLFPGSAEGSLGARLAATFITEVAHHATHAVDIHAGAVGKPNLPQLRISPNDASSMELARAFQPPVVIETGLREGSLRSYYSNKNIPSLLYEASEAYRLDPTALRCGLQGIYGVMQHLRMLPAVTPPEKKRITTVVASGVTWVRAPQGGIFTPLKDLGHEVSVGTKLGQVADPFGFHETPVVSPAQGIIIGINREATADEGDALFHIARSTPPEADQSPIQRSDEIL